MASQGPDLQSDLTTDARPSPPRDNNESYYKEESTKLPPSDEEVNCKTHSYKIPKPKGFSKMKKNNPPAAFAANVININNSNGIHIGSNYTVVMNKPDKSSKKNKDIVETEAIKTLLISKATVTREHLLFISTHMDEGWRDTARILNYSDGQISQFYESHIHSGIKEVIYQFLLDWIQNEPDEATVGKLATTLWNTNQKDVVQRWSSKN